MKRMTWLAAALGLAATLGAEPVLPPAGSPGGPNSRWETVPVSAFGQSGLKIDKLTGDAWYQERVNKEARWVSVPGPLTQAQLESVAYRMNFDVRATGANVYLIDLHGGESWRLADNRGKPYWRKIQ